ncbi:MAG: helix-turn-helix domain-containing protein [Eubacteriaceae bacterium]|nr:helix-turn-helix domain-containing protein [Eubacteriaceae bacterium]
MRIRRDMYNIEDKDIELIACVSDALAHPVRLKIFRYIMQSNQSLEPVCNKELVEVFGYAQATISQHVKKLIQANLVEVKKKDKYSYYYANFGVLVQYLNATKRFSVL